MATKILYHDKCFDGFTAAWAAWRKFGDAAEYIPVSYGQPMPDPDPLDALYFLDFCPPVAYLRNLPSSVRLAILDHHKTAEADLALMKFQPEDVIIFDMNRSGAGIAWDYFHPGKSRPKLVDYAEDHDLWRYRLDYSRQIRAYMHSYPYTFSDWQNLNDSLEVVFKQCVEAGNSIMGFMAQQIKMICDNSYFGMLDGQLVPIVNATSMWSEVGEELNLRHPEYPFSAYWHRLPSGFTKWGLRTKRQDVDVSEIARKYGGGGHKGAAGWVTNNDGI